MEINTYVSPEEEHVFYSNNFSLSVNVQPNDKILAKKFMEAELQAYNHLVNTFGAQFSRKSEFFLEITPIMVELFGQMCYRQANIYNPRKGETYEHLNRFSDEIKHIPSNIKFLFTEACKLANIIPEIKRRMGVAILNFYIEQSQIKHKNRSVVSEDGEIHYTAPYDNLQTHTIFNKKHLQIPKSSCRFEKKSGKVIMFNPYTNKPLELSPEDESIFKSKWNYVILRQKDNKSNNSDWVLDFKRVKKDVYLYKFVDRLGKSGIFEMGKRLY